MTKMLALETSTEVLSVACMENGICKISEKRAAVMRHSEELAPLVAEMMNKVGWSFKELDLLAAGLGPGSFTGIRTGLAFAKVLTFRTDIRLYGIPTMQSWVWAQSENEGQFRVILDARRGMYYTSVWLKDKEQVVEKKQSGMLSAEELILEMKNDPADAFCCGNVMLHASLSGYQPLKRCLNTVPDATHIAKAAWQRFSRGEADNPEFLEPLYLRRAEAELLWEQRYPVVD